MDAEFDAHADLDCLGRNVLDPAHQPETFVQIDQRHVVGGAFARMGDRCRIDRAAPGADPPFEAVAAGIRADHPRIKHRPVRLRAPLIGQFVPFEICLVDRQRRFRNPLHRPSLTLYAFCRVPGSAASVRRPVC